MHFLLAWKPTKCYNSYVGSLAKYGDTIRGTASVQIIYDDRKSRISKQGPRPLSTKNSTQTPIVTFLLSSFNILGLYSRHFKKYSPSRYLICIVCILQLFLSASSLHCYDIFATIRVFYSENKLICMKRIIVLPVGQCYL